MIIKVILIVASVLFLLMLFRHRDRVSLKAGWRVVSVLLVLAAIVCIADPNILQSLADLVGVTRGTDLLLYALVVVFFFTTVGLYFRLREQDRKFVALARALAIESALTRDGIPNCTAGGNLTSDPKLSYED